MRAFRMLAWGEPAELCTVDVPEPRGGEVLLRVAACGACHSDLRIMHSAPRPIELPFTLGHETAGWVEALGPDARGVEIGQAVLVYGPWGCGTCGPCTEGEDSFCEGGHTPGHWGGMGSNGGLADYVVIPDTRLLEPLGDLDPVACAALADAGLTSFHAVNRSRHLLGSLDRIAVVIGVGGLGHLAVQFLRLLTDATIVAIDQTEEKAKLALEVGAHVALTSGADLDEQLMEATGGRRADLVIDFVGSDATLALAGRIARSRGQVTLVGASGGTLPFGFGIFPFECQLSSISFGPRADLSAVVDLFRREPLQLSMQRFPLADVNDVYARLERGEIIGRAVLTP